jgi:hypothetical protein
MLRLGLGGCAVVFVASLAMMACGDSETGGSGAAGGGSTGEETKAGTDELNGGSKPPAFEVTDQDPDKDMDPNAVSPADDPSLPAATQDQLIKRFAPHVHLHPQDSNRPANVDWYLARVTMRFNHNNCPDHEVLGKGKVTQQALIAQKHEDNQSLCRHDGNKTVTSTASEHFFLEIADDATKKGSPRNEWKTYVVWRPKSGGGGLVDVEYWIFYPFNDAFSIINHESDWEHVRQTIDPKANDGQGKLIETKLSAHKGGTYFKAGDPALAMDDGTHPIVYVAKGTHANYAKVGTFDIEGTQGIAKDETKPAASAGDVWKTETTTVLVGTRAAPKNGQVFIKYWGFWGQMGSLPETDGITRHFP